MKRFLLVVSTLCFSVCLLAQTEMAPADAVPPADMSTDMPGDASMQPTAESSQDRIQRECREWAVQDGVPADELSMYINDCVEDRQVQE